MYRFNRRFDDNGLIGIGTVGIFIAILTTASVAAGVLLNSVDELKQEAMDTVDQAIAEVSTRINVRSMYGVRENKNWKIDHLYLHIGLGPGCPPQNLTHLLIHIDDGESQVKLTYHDGSSGPEHYNATVLIDPDERFTHDDPIVHTGTTVQIWINLSATGLKLITDTTCTIRFTPKMGSPTIESFTTPSVFSTRIIHL